MNRSKKFTARGIFALITGTLLATTLSGCFVTPLADGRSPFDDPFDASNADINAGIPVLQQALDGIETGPDWELVAGRASDNCEGACSLRLRAQIIPSDALVDRIREELLAADAPADGYEPRHTVVEIPDDLWRNVAGTSIRTAEQLGLDVTVDNANAELGVVRGEERMLSPTECDVVQRHLGSFGEHRWIYDEERRFRVDGSAIQGASCEVDFYSSEHAGLAEEFGL